MRQIYPDLWLTEIEHPLPDELPELTMQGYLLQRAEGNILFCRSELHADHLQIRELGGLARQYLTHWHEAAPGLARIREMFGSELVCHRLAEERVARHGRVDRTFDAPEVHLGGIEVIPSPGHTPGSSCFRYRSAYGKTYLFAGDTLFPSRGTWQAVVFEDGDAAQLRRSLGMLHNVQADVVLFGASVADVPFKEMSRAEWHAALDEAARSLPENAEAPDRGGASVA